ncbi:BAG family molecular chaperone regulator 6-like [Macadamia integrifolia]|uniref:BAG family molecular chaperone regulator 6-like n=1 Tax=Macadamia integrifolia TaxID=60698 RepID=UPI001C4EC3ED|nr:BAG family molecular chaperone regulator 6-like [Macadamia integrifolia]
MDSPNMWSSSHPRYSSFAREVPIHRRQTNSPKVVTIPVHFVSSEKSRSDAALKIQKVLRGFLIRKNLRKISAIRREVDEIDRRISMEETIQLMGRDPKERLKMNEMLMALLFRLDTVPGINSGVRDCRKALIKRIISLQERLDAIVNGDDSTIDKKDGGETESQTLDMEDISDSPSFKCESVAEELVQTLDTKESASSLGSCEDMVNGTLETKDLSKSLDDSSTLGDAADQEQALDLQSHVASSANSGDQEPFLGAAECQNLEPEAYDESRDDGDTPVEALNKADREVHAFEESGAVAEKDTEEENVMESSQCSHQSMVEEGEEETLKGLEDVKETNSNLKPGITNVGNLDGSPSPAAENREKNRNDINKSNGRDLMERVVEDNERLMGLMTELLERNELQTMLINSLSQRVEQLERAFVSERLKRKKKRQAAAMTVERQDPSLDPRKCVKKSS